MYRILFVDDEEVISMIIESYKFWQESEFQITYKVKNGREALEQLKRDIYDVVITDIHMPVMSGIEFVRQMRKQKDDRVVLLTSSESDFEAAKEGIRLGVFDYIEKPFTETFKRTMVSWYIHSCQYGDYLLRIKEAL
jgi:Response regulator containing CheY-like receiver, AAA-type ATPase, and DNA-binding domains